MLTYDFIGRFISSLPCNNSNKSLIKKKKLITQSPNNSANVALFIALDIVLYFISLFFFCNACMLIWLSVCFCANIDARKSQRMGGKKSIVLMFTELK